jgi:hypothetical protein
MRERIAHLRVRLGVPLAVGFVLGLLGPFGTFDLMPSGQRLVYWLAVVSANWLLADSILRRIGALGRDRLPAPRLVIPFLGALAAAAPAAGVVALANALSGIGWPDNVPLLFGQVLLLLAAISLPVYTWEEARESLARPAEPARPDAETDVGQGTADAAAPLPAQDGLMLFSARLPGPLAGGLLCLEMQDHYLLVHSTTDSTMILCRMEDAARELQHEGLRVHRSWWVAQAALAGVERDGQRIALRLSDGRRVPVGRTYRAALKSAGWL